MFTLFYYLTPSSLLLNNPPSLRTIVIPISTDQRVHAQLSFLFAQSTEYMYNYHSYLHTQPIPRTIAIPTCTIYRADVQSTHPFVQPIESTRNRSHTQNIIFPVCTDGVYYSSSNSIPYPPFVYPTRSLISSFIPHHKTPTPVFIRTKFIHSLVPSRDSD